MGMDSGCGRLGRRSSGSELRVSFIARGAVQTQYQWGVMRFGVFRILTGIRILLAGDRSRIIRTSQRGGECPPGKIRQEQQASGDALVPESHGGCEQERPPQNDVRQGQPWTAHAEVAPRPESIEKPLARNKASAPRWPANPHRRQPCQAATAIIAYSTVQTGPKTHPGGASTSVCGAALPVARRKGPADCASSEAERQPAAQHQQAARHGHARFFRDALKSSRTEKNRMASGSSGFTSSRSLIRRVSIPVTSSCSAT
jgi:hypothetical protein